MNKFIDARNANYDINNPYAFPLLLLNAYDFTNKDKTIDLNESKLIKNITYIKKLALKDALREEEVDDLFSMLAFNPYLDRYIVDLILKDSSYKTMSIIKKSIRKILEQKSYKGDKAYHLLDICIEKEMDLFKRLDLEDILKKYKLDLDTLSITLDYMEKFKVKDLKNEVCNLLKKVYPDTIKFQIYTYLQAIGEGEFDETYLKSHIRHEKNKEFYDSFVDFLNSNLKFEPSGLSILQSMFYGDFEDSGKGNNGGLAILLKGLGDELSKDQKISNVFTITISQNLNRVFIKAYDGKHIFVRLPIYLDESISDPYVKRETFIKRYISKFLKKAAIDPHIFHIRYLDNASKAVASICKDFNKKLVFTLTPDPHRNMFDSHGDLVHLNLSDLITRLNKIKIGDELINLSDGIVGIGNKGLEDELCKYFPQLKEVGTYNKLRMIGEGIIVSKGEVNESYLKDFIIENKINETFFEKPIILNIGRLSRQKGQVELLRAWGQSMLSQSHNLLIIGGDFEKPNKEELSVMDSFTRYIESNPYLKEGFFHKQAMTNTEIRLLEKSIIKKTLITPIFTFVLA